MAHSAGEDPMVAEHAVAFWNRLRAHTDGYNAEIHGLFDRIDPALQRIETHQDGLYATVSMRISLRLPPSVDPSIFGQLLETWAEGAQIKVSNADSAYRVKRSTALARAFSRAIRARGARPHIKLKTGTSDMNAVGPVWNCPILAYGPGDSHLDHTPTERIELAEYRRSIDVLCDTLRDLDASEAGRRMGGCSDPTGCGRSPWCGRSDRQ
jgi:LysW-gamma-L-lysine carboxypeptidase